MTTIHDMFTAHPVKPVIDNQVITDCIKACFDCAAFCISCADACLSEQNVGELAKCINLNQDCAEMCIATGKLLLKQSNLDWGLALKVAEACERACRLCGDECKRHASMHEHCQICADMCHICKEACKDLIQGAANLA